MTTNSYRAATIFTAILLVSFSLQFAKADMRGKSIQYRGQYDFIICKSSGQCKRTDKVNSNIKIYVSKDGKQVYDYTSKLKGDLIPVGGKKVTVANGIKLWSKLSGNRLTVSARAKNLELTTTYTARGRGQCKVTDATVWHQAGLYSKGTRTFQRICRIYEGNRFSK